MFLEEIRELREMFGDSMPSFCRVVAVAMKLFFVYLVLNPTQWIFSHENIFDYLQDPKEWDFVFWVALFGVASELPGSRDWRQYIDRFFRVFWVAMWLVLAVLPILMPRESEEGLADAATEEMLADIADTTSILPKSDNLGQDGTAIFSNP